MNISVVPSSMIDLIWDKVVPLIDMVIEKAPDDIDEDTVHESLKADRQLLVAISEGAEIIAINVLHIKTLDSGSKVLYIPITAGSRMEEWMEGFLALATKIAKHHDCIELRGLAVRNGWLKKLKPLGWEELFTTIRCKIGE